MKAKTVFFCTECGNETPKWSGRCPACGAWNTIVEQTDKPVKSGRKSVFSTTVKAERITDLGTSDEIRFLTGMGELDRVLGGGAVKGSLVLVGGAPGIGKSTLMLQICKKLGEFSKVLYVSGEESDPPAEAAGAAAPGGERKSVCFVGDVFRECHGMCRGRRSRMC